MQLKSKTNLFVALGAIVLGALTLVFISSKLRPEDTSAFAGPSIKYLEVDRNQVIVHAKSNEPNTNEQFVYCMTTTKDSSNCRWDNSDEFKLEKEGDYYFFVKSLASGKISEPKLKTYQIVDYSNFKL